MNTFFIASAASGVANIAETFSVASRATVRPRMYSPVEFTQLRMKIMSAMRRR